MTKPATNDAQKTGILLVDDEPSITEVIKSILEDLLGVTVHAFNDPLKAVAAAPALSFSLIITDWLMPNLNGLDLVRRIQEKTPDVPWLIITGNVLDRDEVARKKIPGYLGLMNKPLSAIKLAKVVEEKLNLGHSGSNFSAA